VNSHSPIQCLVKPTRSDQTSGFGSVLQYNLGFAPSAAIHSNDETAIICFFDVQKSNSTLWLVYFLFFCEIWLVYLKQACLSSDDSVELADRLHCTKFMAYELWLGFLSSPTAHLKKISQFFLEVFENVFHICVHFHSDLLCEGLQSILQYNLGFPASTDILSNNQNVVICFFDVQKSTIF
jgi:hypothetical protein